jgi:hypothetical protein
MRTIRRTLCAALALCWAVAVQAAGDPHYSLTATLEPATHGLAVQASITLPPATSDRTVESSPAAPLEIVAAEPTVEKVPIEGVRAFAGINGSSAAICRCRPRRPLSSARCGRGDRIALRYRGKIDFTFDSPAQEYARGFMKRLARSAVKAFTSPAALFGIPTSARLCSRSTWRCKARTVGNS